MPRHSDTDVAKPNIVMLEAPLGLGNGSMHSDPIHQEKEKPRRCLSSGGRPKTRNGGDLRTERPSDLLSMHSRYFLFDCEVGI